MLKEILSVHTRQDLSTASGAALSILTLHGG
jgi:hypothetical protein